MCNNHMCPKCDTCYRYVATPDIYQSYFILDEGFKQQAIKDCDYYWEIHNANKIQKDD